jgi:hypothetical protein
MPSNSVADPLLPENTRHALSVRHARFARIMTGTIIGLVVLMVSVIYWRGAFTHVPTTAIVINGDPSLEGATVNVSGKGESGRAVDLTIPLNFDNDYRTPVLLDPGNYRIRTMHRGQVILNESLTLQYMKPIGFVLPTAVWFQGAAELGDLRVEVIAVNSVFRPHSFLLNAAGHYRLFTHLFAGEYQLTARSVRGENAVVRTLNFVVDHGGVARIDLNRPADPDGSILPDANAQPRKVSMVLGRAP